MSKKQTIDNGDGFGYNVMFQLDPEVSYDTQGRITLRAVETVCRKGNCAFGINSCTWYSPLN